ncbi:histidine kinase [Clostridium sp. SHJSY1]|uniref:sensor histidine kinase n=1 Tax=Clostridium sp. SHJSY1 TaxID=2942483 RepID=UPI00287B77E9|nr:histidine kinase [Clostridium sp. SHJSY1]
MVIVNDHIRQSNFIKNSIYIHDISLLLSILGTSILAFFIKGLEANIFTTFPLSYLLILKGKRLLMLFYIHFLLYLMLMISFIGMPNSWMSLSALIPSIFGYFAIVYNIYSEIRISKEKEKINELNRSLKLANIKLRKYSLEVEELTATKERTMMSQELHDSVGHSLMALVMYIEFAKKMCDVNPKKVKEVLIKSEDIAKSSISDLRKAVSLLKEERRIEYFNNSIKDIINNFNMINDIKINFDTTENLDNLNTIIKSAMYNTIKESITNSIKHGQSTNIDIKISLKNNILRLILNDNGIGCAEIIKSNGLLGIESRVNSLNGSVKYSNNSMGFSINIYIPILMEEIQNDKCYTS